MAGIAATSLVAGAFSSSVLADIENAPAGVVQDIVNVAGTVAKQRNLTPTQTTELKRTSVATAAVETGGTFSPTSVGDQGTSLGLFQLHRGGELGNLTQTQAFDPVTNAKVAVSHIADVLQLYPSSPQTNLGVVAASAQRPANQTGYAASINADLLQTSSPVIGLTPSGQIITPGQNNPALVNAPGEPGASTSTTGLLAKIGGFLLAMMLIGIGLILLFKDTAPAQAATGMAKKAVMT